MVVWKDRFSIQGPQGTHVCDVCDTMGPNIVGLSIASVPGDFFNEVF